MFFKNPGKSQVPAEYKMQCCSWLGFSSRTGFDCIFPVVYCRLWCVRKLESACSSEMRHWWFGLLALPQEMWQPGPVTLFCLIIKCRNCDGVCAKSHYRAAWRGPYGGLWWRWAQDPVLCLKCSLCPHTGTRNSLPCKPLREL